jgi:ribonuclease-3
VEDRLAALQQRLGHAFGDPALLQRALTHRSFGADHYERLEFLGDAVLSLAISGLLYERSAASAEGDLTRVRAHLVREDTLHKVALALRLPEVLRLSDGELRGGGALRPSILADATEALIGAVHLDAGFEAARAVVQRLFGELIQAADAEGVGKDAKTELQEWLQARGQAHAQTFEVEGAVPSLALTQTGEGRSRRAAEQEAARRMLEWLKANDRPGGPLQS